MSDLKYIEDYQIASASSASGLTEKVCGLIKAGWQPYRSAYGVTSHKSGAAVHCQPMVKGSW